MTEGGLHMKNEVHATEEGWQRRCLPQPHFGKGKKGTKRREGGTNPFCLAGASDGDFRAKPRQSDSS